MPKTLLLGLDGATFTVLDPLIKRGKMPFLEKLIAEGVRSPLRSIVPALTPPAWTTVMTGKRPGKHGVFDFFQKEEPDSRYFQFASSHNVKSETIWSVASEHGLKVVSLNFPLMFPPPAVNGYIVPGGWMPWRQLRLGCYPPGLFDRLKSLPSFNPRELALDMTLEAKALEGCAAEEYADWIRLHSRREARWSEILRSIMADDDVDLVGVVFDGADKLQHLCWRFLDPAMRPAEPNAWEQEIIDLCEEYFARLDAILADIVEQAGADATVVVASDHGFGASHDVFYINAWLEEQGFLVWKDEAWESQEVDPQIGFANITRHINELNWDRTVAYAATPSSLGINIVEQPNAVGGRDRATILADLVSALRQVRNPWTGQPIVAQIHSRDEAFAGPFERYGPDLTLTLADGAAISILRSDVLFRRRDIPLGNHKWDGVFIARGPGIRAGESVDEVSLVDIAPLLLYSLDLPIPTDVDGVVPPQVVRPEQIEQRPPKWFTPEGATAMPTESDIEIDSDDEATILSRLRALGYVE